MGSECRSNTRCPTGSWGRSSVSCRCTPGRGRGRCSPYSDNSPPRPRLTRCSAETCQRTASRWRTWPASRRGTRSDTLPRASWLGEPATASRSRLTVHSPCRQARFSFCTDGWMESLRPPEGSWEWGIVGLKKGLRALRRAHKSWVTVVRSVFHSGYRIPLSPRIPLHPCGGCVRENTHGMSTPWCTAPKTSRRRRIWFDWPRESSCQHHKQLPRGKTLPLPLACGPVT